MLVDSTGDLHSVVAEHRERQVTTIRLDEGYPANFVIRSVSGRVQVDGVKRSGIGTGPTTNFVGIGRRARRLVRRHPRQLGLG